MKLKQLLKYNIPGFLILLLFAGTANGQDEKKKFIEKSYKVSPSTRLDIENKFGKVEINSSSKSEFAIQIEIIAKGKNEERAQRILDEIEIEINESSSKISFETEVDGNKSKNNEGFEVNYTISMPDANPLSIRNSFGDVTMGNRENDLDLHVSYGSMKVGNVAGKVDVRLSFGSGSIGDTRQGNFTVKYSKLDIESGTKMDLEQGFSDIELGEVDDLELESKYGKVEIEKARKIDADVHFSGFEIEELTGSLELDCSYLGDFSIERLARTFTLVDIDGKFGSYEIGIEPGLAANIEAEFSFADLRVSSDVDATFHYRVKESNQSTYRGKIGKGDPNKLIKIDSGYGNLRLRVD